MVMEEYMQKAGESWKLMISGLDQLLRDLTPPALASNAHPPTTNQPHPMSLLHPICS